MTGNQPREYLEARVQTANSAQLHLMLLDGALRFGREAEKGLLRGDEQAYQAPLLRTMDIVEELLAGVRHSTDDLNEKLAQLYTFIYSRLTSVYVNGDKGLMADALRILEIQQETWRQAVATLRDEGSTEAKPSAVAARSQQPKPHLGSAANAPSGLSIQA